MIPWAWWVKWGVALRCHQLQRVRSEVEAIDADDAMTSVV